MWGAVKGMFASKKFVAAIAGAIVALVAKLGVEMETESVMAVITPILAFVVGQGIADAGKEAKKVENGSSST